jgi:universal stress protein E
MARKPQRILVVVDPTAAINPAFVRATTLARQFEWSLELLICIHGGLPVRRLTGPESRAVRRTLLGHQLGHLRDLAGRVRDVEIEVKAVWDRPLHEAIIRESLRIDARLVVKDAHYHSALSRALYTSSDWHLIRDCPVPLLLARTAAWAERPLLLVCVDPLHAHDKSAELDRRLISEAKQIAARTGGVVHVLHCYDSAPLITGTSGGPLAGTAAAMENIAAEVHAEHASALNALAAATGIKPEHTHFRSASAAEAIPAVARTLGASLVVMGAVARSRLTRAFIGNTAERVLEQLASDVLIIKPRRFESAVMYRSQPADFMALQ